jgi:NAD(P)-dependent dehydrogenase (short-subunit alcohol dehydrogenase family)
MTDLFNLHGKNALITGGYGHLGKAMSHALHDAGANVVIGGKSKEKFGESFQKEDRIHFLAMDLESERSMQQAFARLDGEYGGLDILINNAFYSQQFLPQSKDFSAWEYSIEGILNSTLKCIELAVPYLKKSNSPRIVNIASMYGIQIPDFDLYTDYKAFFNPPSYGVAKAGIIHLTKYYAKFLATDHILVNAISPGPFPSEKVQQEKGFIQELNKRSPMQRIGKPNELGGALVFLSSEASSYITGHNLVVDGGWTL